MDWLILNLEYNSSGPSILLIKTPNLLVNGQPGGGEVSLLIEGDATKRV